MIDVLLVLIIVFMVVVSMDKKQGETAEIPQPATDSSVPPPERTIVIQVEQESPNDPPLVKINDQSVGWSQLQSRLQQIFVGRMEKVAFVKGDKELSFQKVADVLDIAHAAGIDHVGLITSEPKQEARVH
jgi:biopolymer transport protein ExbD/biopolymer transport protein TolR